jgi:multicomponent Na+:H+ antiporter subunit D
VVLTLLASMIFLAACGLAYAATGTVNLAELAERMAELPSGIRDAIALLLLVAFGIKAAVFPLFNWLPDSYPTAPAPISAVFAGLLTKVGVYAIIRTQTLLAPPGGASTLLLVLAALTMLTGVLGAIAQDDVKRILSFHIVSQIGYMIMGLALFSVAGLAAAVFFVVHQIPVKTSLFLVGGIVEADCGTSSLKRLSGYARRAPFAAALFLLAAFSLAGIPPLSGFVGKFALIRAGLDQGQWWIVAASLVASVLTLFSMTKIWNGAFWGAPTTTDASSPAPRRSMAGATAALVAVTLAVAAFARPIYDLSERAAVDLLDRSAYVTEVLGR